MTPASREVTQRMKMSVRAPTAAGPGLGRLERATLKLSIKTLELRADAGSRVVISAKLARVIAGYLKLLLERDG